MLYKKRDFVRDMKKDMEMLGGMVAKRTEFHNIEDERGMDDVLVCGLVLFM